MHAATFNKIERSGIRSSGRWTYKPQVVYPCPCAFQGIQMNWIIWIRTIGILQRLRVQPSTRLLLIQTPTISLRVSRATFTSDKLATNLRLLLPPQVWEFLQLTHRTRKALQLVQFYCSRGNSNQSQPKKRHRLGSQRITNAKLQVPSPYRIKICRPLHTSVCNNSHSILPSRDAFLSLGLQSFYWSFIM